MILAEQIGALSALMLRQFDPETAHTFAVLAMRLHLAPPMPTPRDERLEVPFFDLTAPHPVGLAAGFDKDAEIADQLLGQGFGHVEVGTLTPLPQPGNPKPRIFRLPESRAVINRCGFNGKGHAAALKRLAARAGRPGMVGVNVGANKDSPDRPGDYIAGITAFAPFASYLAANVSSPNTPGLRDLQARAALDDLIARCIEARDATVASVGRRVPFLVKVAPDIDEAGLDDIADVALGRGLDGLIVSNTTLSRTGVSGRHAGEAGGLSGSPLYERSTIVLAKLRQRLGPQTMIIGVGGVASGEELFQKLAAGADLVQIYTSFIYAGGNAVIAMLRDLLRRMDADGIGSIREITGTATADWASRRIPL